MNQIQSYQQPWGNEWYSDPALQNMTNEQQLQVLQQQQQQYFHYQTIMMNQQNMGFMPGANFQYMPAMQVGFPSYQQHFGTLHDWEKNQERQQQEQMAYFSNCTAFDDNSVSLAQNSWAQNSTWTSEDGVEEPTTHKRPLEGLEELPAEAKKMKLATEDPISRYEKLHCCGHGTFGKVWSAKEISTEQPVALKQIKLSTGTEGFPRTAIREIIIMKKHAHPNILSIKEVVWSKDGDEVFLVMDFYNYDLRKLLEKYQLKFNSSEVKYLFRQLAAGVAYLHENILMHRDLKTENILINTTGQLKICDFGLSRAFNPEGRMKTYTPVVITLWYRPPELLLGPCAYSCEVDQWSVGCIFAEIVRSSVLFAGNSEVDQVDKIFSIMGSPTDAIWPEYVDLPGAQKFSFRTYSNRLRTLVSPDILSSAGFDLLTKLLTYRPEDRITAAQTLNHPYFSEFPDPVTSIDVDSKVNIFFNNKNKS